MDGYGYTDPGDLAYYQQFSQAPGMAGAPFSQLEEYANLMQRLNEQVAARQAGTTNAALLAPALGAAGATYGATQPAANAAASATGAAGKVSPYLGYGSMGLAGLLALYGALQPGARSPRELYKGEMAQAEGTARRIAAQQGLRGGAAIQSQTAALAPFQERMARMESEYQERRRQGIMQAVQQLAMLGLMASPLAPMVMPMQMGLAGYDTWRQGQGR